MSNVKCDQLTTPPTINIAVQRLLYRNGIKASSLILHGLNPDMTTVIIVYQPDHKQRRTITQFPTLYLLFDLILAPYEYSTTGKQQKTAATAPTIAVPH
jgi:hypothetical protein